MNRRQFIAASALAGAGLTVRAAADDSRRARRRAFVGGLLIGVLAARRR